MTNKTVLVAGGAGYIGAQTCKVLKENGYNPVVFDNLVYGHKEFVQWGLFEQGDLLDSKKIVEVFEKHKPYAVMHFAAYAYVGESVEKPEKYYQKSEYG